MGRYIQKKILKRVERREAEQEVHFLDENMKVMHVDYHLFSRGQHSALKRILRWLVRARAAHKELFICATPSFKRFWCDNSEARQEDDNVNNLESLHGLRISQSQLRR